MRSTPRRACGACSAAPIAPPLSTRGRGGAKCVATLRRGQQVSRGQARPRRARRRRRDRRGRRCGGTRSRRARSRSTERADRNVLLITIDTLRADAMSAYGGRASTPHLDRARRARRALHVRARARGRDAAVAHQPAHRHLSVRARRPRQQRLSRASRSQATLATQAQGARLRHRRVRRRLPARSALRSQRRLRRLRRSDRRNRQHGRLRPAGAPRRRRRRIRRSTGSRAQTSRSGSRGCTSSIRTRPTSRPRNSRGAIPATRTPREVAWTDCALGAALRVAWPALPRPTLVIVTADHGESLGEHGELTHGIFAYESTLRVPLIVAELGRRQRRARPGHRPSTPPCGTSTSCRRSSTRLAPRPSSTLPGASLVDDHASAAAARIVPRTSRR